jgi:glycosyltransferase involved in cell wall biosynthesis
MLIARASHYSGLSMSSLDRCDAKASEGSRLTDPERPRATVYVLIPAYDEAATIRDVVERALRHADKVIVVDDGSRDGTGELIKDLPITLIRQEENGGKASALMRGFDYALSMRADAVVTLDADGQHRPEEIPLFTEAHRAHPNHMIVGSRLWNRTAVPAVRYWANRFASLWVSWASGVRLEDCQSGFRLYPATLLKAIGASYGAGSGFTFESEILINAARAGFAISFVPICVTYPADHMQSTHYDHVRDNARMIKMIAKKLLSRLLRP